MFFPLLPSRGRPSPAQAEAASGSVRSQARVWGLAAVAVPLLSLALWALAVDGADGYSRFEAVGWWLPLFGGFGGMLCGTRAFRAGQRLLRGEGSRWVLAGAVGLLLSLACFVAAVAQG